MLDHMVSDTRKVTSEFLLVAKSSDKCKESNSFYWTREKSKNLLELWYNDNQREQTLSQLGGAGYVLLSQNLFFKLFWASVSQNSPWMTDFFIIGSNAVDRADDMAILYTSGFSQSKMQLILELVSKTQVSVRQLSAWARRQAAL